MYDNLSKVCWCKEGEGFKKHIALALKGAGVTKFHPPPPHSRCVPGIEASNSFVGPLQTWARGISTSWMFGLNGLRWIAYGYV